MRRAGTGVVADRPVFSTFNLNSALYGYLFTPTSTFYHTHWFCLEQTAETDVRTRIVQYYGESVVPPGNTLLPLFFLEGRAGSP